MAKTPTSPRRATTPSTASKSATVRAAHAAPSRRQLSRWGREQQQRRALFAAIGLLALLMVAILVGGWVLDNVVRPRDVVADVAGDHITAGALADALRPAAQAVDAQARQSGAAGTSPLLDQQKRQLPDQVLNTLVEQDIIQQEADRRGISVPPDEVDRRVQQTLAQVDAASRPTPAGDASPLAADAPGATPTSLPTLEPAANEAAAKKLQDQYGLTEPQLRERIRQSALYDGVQKSIGAELVPESQEQVRARHILVKTTDEANGLLAQLQGGADFAQLAQTTSIDPGSKDKGGDLGWFPRGIMTKPFEDAAFALQPGQLSDVVQSPDGYHVIQVLERDPTRPVASDQLARLRQQAVSTWLDGKRTGPDVTLQLNPADRDWALSRVGVRP